MNFGFFYDFHLSSSESGSSSEEDYCFLQALSLVLFFLSDHLSSLWSSLRLFVVFTCFGGVQVSLDHLRHDCCSVYSLLDDVSLHHILPLVYLWDCFSWSSLSEEDDELESCSSLSYFNFEGWPVYLVVPFLCSLDLFLSSSELDSFRFIAFYVTLTSSSLSLSLDCLQFLILKEAYFVDCFWDCSSSDSFYSDCEDLSLSEDNLLLFFFVCCFWIFAFDFVSFPISLMRMT